MGKNGGLMLSRSEAVAKLRRLMAVKFPQVAEFKVVAKSVRLAHYGYASAVWDGGKCAFELLEPYRLEDR